MNEKVLFVDDEPAVLEGYRSYGTRRCYKLLEWGRKRLSSTFGTIQDGLIPGWWTP